ncbi:uncharacterized protein TrAtP1_011862 [Trichoderma atroviride]|uniref:uncharacterized protein n=1 Tax=Hypocrea atroviridis TaxID=63577 RepID=UPI003326C87E|nr:hypothetical protein TrAtP1_011862 [Trichoderma atroviride]
MCQASNLYLLTTYTLHGMLTILKHASVLYVRQHRITGRAKQTSKELTVSTAAVAVTWLEDLCARGRVRTRVATSKPTEVFTSPYYLTPLEANAVVAKTPRSQFPDEEGTWWNSNKFHIF